MTADFFNNKLILKSNAENETLKFILDFMKNKPEYAEFSSGGTTDESRRIKRSVRRILKECKVFYDALNLPENLEFISTTTLNHRYGFTTQFLFPASCGYCINTERINYPEDLKIKRAVLVTTPSFLDMMRKYDYMPEVCPEIIISAGAKLKDETFKYARSIAKRVIDMYGSSETGIIGWREHENELIRLMDGVNIIECGDNYTKISTEYSDNDYEILGDRLEQDGRCVRFLSRNGRILKAQEKRIDSVCLEEEIKKLPFIEDCICIESKGKIAVLSALNKDGMNFIIENDKLTLIKKLKSALSKRFEIIPQRWKFIDEIPKTLNGKINREEIQRIFDRNLSFPLVISREIHPQRVIFNLYFMSGSNFFKGHFEGMPILPGVVELFYADYFTKAAFGIQCRRGQIRKIKFSNIIQPDQTIQLELVKSETSVSFKYFSGNKIYSSGIFPLKSFL